jgi:hypothetical protein
VVYAQTAGDKPVLHEFVKIEPAAVARGKQLLPSENGVSDVPRGIVYKDEVLPQPSANPELSQKQTNMVPDSDTVVPDNETEKEGVLKYEEVFNPAITPHKRNRAIDSVNEQANLVIRDSTLRPIPVIGNTSDPDRDLFYGALDLILTAGQAQPIPSVSPESRILSYKTTPNVSLRFYQDSADNFYVMSDESITLRLVFLTDAPKDYFNGEIPAVTLADVPSSMAPYVPPQLKKKAEKVIDAVGLSRKETSYKIIVEKLIEYFSSFEAGTFEDSSEDLYLALSLSKQGVCRHRAYAFAITAQSLGVPARYVFNDAHAWVEVYIPKMGWRLVDLGGASAGLDVAGARGKPMYEPEKKDPFDSLRPDSNDGAETGGGESRPFGGAGGFDRAIGTRPGPDDGSGSGNGAATASNNGGDPNGAGADPNNVTDNGSSEAPTSDTPPPAPSLASGTTPVTLLLQKVTNQVLRGQNITVQGLAQADTGPASGLRVEIYIEREDTSRVKLGAATTNEQGIFSGEFVVPFDQSPLGTYRVSLVTTGNATYAPSVTQ